MRFLLPMYVKFQSMMPTLLKDKKGATMVEYALMVALIAVIAVGAVQLLGQNVDGTFQTINGSMNPAP